MNAPCRCMDVASTSPRCVPLLARSRHSAVMLLRNPNYQLHCINPRVNSINAATAVPIDRPRTLSNAPSHRADAGSGFSSDILGLGQAIVDWSSSVSDEFLQGFDVPKGGRRVITVDERASVMETLDELGAPSQVSAGGSLANTLVGVAKLARAAGKDMRVVLGGSLGTDTLGQFFNSQMRQAGVRCIIDTHSHHQHHPEHQSQAADTAAAPISAHGHTGTVMVLTTPDAQRSFLSFFTSETLDLSDRLRTAVAQSRLVVVEGYLWEMPGAEDYITQVLDLAHASGVLVAMTAGDPGVVARHRQEMLRVITRGVDLFFANEDEAAALVELQSSSSSAPAGDVNGTQDDIGSGCRRSWGERAALALAELCPMAVVTAGSKGSFVAAMGELHVVAPHWMPQGPVDTCGAGDAYAAGWLYAILVGYDIRTAGEFASRVASAVIGRYGAHLSDEDAEDLVGMLPEHVGPLGVRVGGRMEFGAGDFANF